MFRRQLNAATHDVIITIERSRKKIHQQKSRKVIIHVLVIHM